MTPLLEIRSLKKYFKGLAAIDGVDIVVFDSEISGLIGPNGAGKTTLFNVLTGFLAPTSGQVTFKGKDITGLTPHRIVRRGIRRTFQASTLFTDLTVFENILAGFHLNYKVGLIRTFLHTPAAGRERERIEQKCTEIIEFMGLASLKDEMAGNLPYGYQRLLGISMALTTDPELLLLDEPAGGMNPQETLEIGRIIKKIRDKGITILLVEHDMRLVMNLCDRIMVLNYGKKIAEGLPKEVRSNRSVIEAYLGSEESSSVA